MNALQLLARYGVAKAPTGGGGGGPPTTNLQVWLAADEITGLSDGDPVATWADLSGNGSDATNATGADQPLYKTGILNSLPVVRFDGSTDELILPNLGLAADAFTMIGVFIPTADNLVQIVSNGNLVFALYNNLYHMKRGSALTFPASATTNGIGNLISVVCSGTPAGYVNGVDVTGTTSSTFTSGLYYGLARNNHWQGDMAEVLIYDAALGSTEREAAESYLADKWGITI